ncbi:MAG: HlyD family secretion protein [Candidatus Paracaedibacteraceae bacterium]|nr:HlyD family secretion protein [Candidatus Paracaedibacteraceae bacterium]
MAIPESLKQWIKDNSILIGSGLAIIFLGYWFFCIHGFESTDNAYVKADMTVISPRVNGYITEVLVDENQSVKKDQLLARIDDRDYKSRFEQAESQVRVISARIRSLESQVSLQEAMIDQTKAGMDSANATYEQASKENKRIQKLLKDGAVSQQMMDAVTAQYKNAKALVDKSKAEQLAAENQKAAFDAQLEEGRAQLVNVQAQADQAQRDLAYTEVKAPFDGKVGRKAMQIGQLVRPGVALAYLVPNDVWIEANFKETQITKMRSGNRVWVEVDAYPDVKFRGRVDSLAPASGSEFSILPPENATGNFTKIVRRIPVKLVLKGADLDKLKPGMSCYATVRCR